LVGKDFDMSSGWGIESEISAAFVWIFAIALMFGFFKFAAFFANATARKKGLDPDSKEGVDHAWKNFKWIAPLLLFAIYIIGLIGRNKGWWGQ
jgi:hypothetical protein